MVKHVRTSFLTPLFAAGIFLAFFSLAPMSASAEVFTYEGPPTFSVTYFDDMTPHPDNPDNLPLRLGTDGSIPILEVAVRDIPEDLELEGVSERLLARYRESTGGGDLVVDESITLSCGTEAHATQIEFLFQGFFPLDAYVVSAFKDDKWVLVTTTQSAGSGITELSQSLTFK